MRRVDEGAKVLRAIVSSLTDRHEVVPHDEAFESFDLSGIERQSASSLQVGHLELVVVLELAMVDVAEGGVSESA